MSNWEIQFHRHNSTIIRHLQIAYKTYASICANKINEIKRYSIANSTGQLKTQLPMHCCSVVAFTYFFCCFCLYAISAYVISFVCVFSLCIWHRHDFHFIHSFIKKKFISIIRIIFVLSGARGLFNFVCIQQKSTREPSPPTDLTDFYCFLLLLLVFLCALFCRRWFRASDRSQT